MTPPLKTLLISLGLSLGLALPVLAQAQNRESQRKPAASVAAKAKKAKAQRSSVQRPVAVRATQTRRVAAVAAEPARASFGQLQGLHGSLDPLDLKSSVALVVDQDTNEVLLSKNPGAVLPIASITKLMTALLVVEAQQPLDEMLTISQEDVDTEKGTGSRLSVGTQLTRGEMLHLALMSSENRAANALGRHYPGGLANFVPAMNRKAQALGMADTHYVEPTGLSSRNQSSAQDLARLVKVAHQVPLLRELSTSQEAQVAVGRRVMQFRNTNGLIRNPEWEIGLQKTGYIVEAGRCVVMQAQLAGRKLIMVLLDSAGKYSRIGDAERIRRWLDNAQADQAPPARRRAS
ncbi:MAG: D-alanyl-D-alanine endopeptidase [Burkholderiaceae bacterium]|nr:D-alanyl-D-alanine endopeptidase [Burkholderiaceae bacterium]